LRLDALVSRAACHTTELHVGWTVQHIHAGASAASEQGDVAKTMMETFEPPKYLTGPIAGERLGEVGTAWHWRSSRSGLFLQATEFSATDEDLLLNRALTSSQLDGTAVPVVFAFGSAPAVFVPGQHVVADECVELPATALFETVGFAAGAFQVWCFSPAVRRVIRSLSAGKANPGSGRRQGSHRRPDARPQAAPRDVRALGPALGSGQRLRAVLVLLSRAART
jgi:hypothetical protein